MKDRFPLWTEAECSVEVERLPNGVTLSIGRREVRLTPSEARQVAAALTRLAALRPVDGDAA